MESKLKGFWPKELGQLELSLTKMEKMGKMCSGRLGRSYQRVSFERSFILLFIHCLLIDYYMPELGWISGGR